MTVEAAMAVAQAEEEAREGEGSTSPSLIREAIEIIRECRQIHTNWADWQESDPDWEAQTSPLQVGDAAHHREWEAKYDKVLAALDQTADKKA